jgi:hypothetical protein
MSAFRHSRAAIWIIRAAAAIVVSGSLLNISIAIAAAPAPRINASTAVDWWFVFKFNSKSFPGCPHQVARSCTFGGTVQPYKMFGQQYVSIDSRNVDAGLKVGDGCVGESAGDPIGATFSEVYSGSAYFVIWNDQLYGDPKIPGCSGSKGNCDSPWGHSKGMLAWDENGDGFVMQVSTPSWPAAGSKKMPRSQRSGNTLGCVADNDVMVSQHFFALRLSKDDVVNVLKGLRNASVVTDPADPQIVRNGGPVEIQALVKSLGKRSDADTPTHVVLSTKVELISKPSALHVPPWQMVSAILGGVPLRTATWWASPYIPTTTGGRPKCWSEDETLRTLPGRVEIATTGSWDGVSFGLTGGLGGNFNHAKLGVSLALNSPYAIFGDLNQQGDASGRKCESSQNGRGGLFFVVENESLRSQLRKLIDGDTAPTTVK